MTDWLSTYHQRGWALTQLHWITTAGLCSCGRTDPEHRRQAGKHPTSASWQTTGLVSWPAIEAAWQRHPDANVGIVTGRASGIWCLDIDPDHGGDRGLAALEAAYGALPATYIVETGSGGRHMLWTMPGDGSDLGNGRGALPPGIDVRGTGGQIVAPPSRTIMGPYKMSVDVAPIAAPAWLLSVIRTRPERLAAEPAAYDAAGYEIVSEGDARARAYVGAAVAAELGQLSAAVEGTRNDTAFRVACALLELANATWSGLSADVAWASFWNTAQRMADPLPGLELEHVWRSALARVGDKARDRPGTTELSFLDVSAIAPPPQLAPTGQDLPFAQQVAQAVGPAIDPRDLVAVHRSRLLTRSALRGIEPPAPLVDGWLYMDSLAWLIGRPGSAKSFLALDLALSLASERPWLGSIPLSTGGNALYIAAEGASGLSERIEAWQRLYGVTDAQLDDRLYVDVLPTQASDHLAWSVLVQVARELRPALVVVDTQARVTVGIDENSNTDMGVFIDRLEALRRATGACVVPVHHTNAKDEERGASALRGAAQTTLHVSKAGAEVTLEVRKQKDAPEADALKLRVQAIDGTSSIALVRPLNAAQASLEERAAAAMAREADHASAVDLIAGVMSDVFAAGNGGTKAEVGRLVRAELGRRGKGAAAAEKAFHRAWGQVVEAGQVERVQGRQSYRWVTSGAPAVVRLPADVGFEL